ncbi:hypothetical protein M9434_000684 [Picochlorum sp. BPE23]|nr:hypothetical protein M9434_000684 [Picochlorum sp. BPE23]
MSRALETVRHAATRALYRYVGHRRCFGTFERGNFKVVDEKDVSYFKQLLGAGSVVYQNAFDLEAYNRDWLGKYRGNSSLVLKPKSTDEVSHVLSYCHEHSIALAPQGGNTGLVGGSVPVFDEVVLSMSRMNSIHAFDEISGVVECDAGCVLEDIDQFLLQKGYTVPLDLGAKGSCQIGGNVATNAGGLRFLRYGSLHGSVLGLEVVLPSGEVLDQNTSVRKDNTGYDLKQLFIGSEGTLGVITKVALMCPQEPKSIHLCYLACPTFSLVTEVLKLAKKELGEILAAFEYLDQESVDIAVDTLSLRNPLGINDERMYYIVLETRGSHHDHDAEKVEQFLELCMSKGVVSDGTIAQDATQSKAIWELRESVTEALRVKGATYKYDVSVPIYQMDDVVQETRERLRNQPDCLVVGYGHVADNNLHLNISVPKYSDAIRDMLEPWIYAKVTSLGGSISAEHGIGQMKSAALAQTKPKNALHLMRDLKKTIDPKGIMNPYKIFTTL